MNWFKRKPREVEPLCFHEWRVADISVRHSYNGMDSDSYTSYTLGCSNCGKTREVGEYEFAVLKSSGMINGGVR